MNNQLHRRSCRLKGFDYTQAGAYFLTMVAHDRACVFGEIIDETAQLSAVGQMITREWQRLAHRFLTAELDAWVVMPNHVHGIIVITDREERPGLNTSDHPDPSHISIHSQVTVEQFGAPVAGSIPTMIRAFKASTTIRYRRMNQDKAAVLWQQNYYEHVIRSDLEWENIRDYIHNNPNRWAEDRENRGPA